MGRTLELSNGKSIDPIDAGLQILHAGEEEFWRLGFAKGLRPVSEDVDILGDPVVLFEKRMDEVMHAAVEEVFGDAYVLSEEGGLTVVGRNPQILVEYDDIDGTMLLREDPEGGLYGPMVSIFSNTNPKFGDAVFGGFTLLNAHQTYYGDGETAHVIEPLRGSRVQTRRRPVETSGETELNERTRLDSMETIFELFGADYSPIKKTLAAHGITRTIPRHKSSAVHHARVGDARRPDARDAAIEFRRKRDLEAGTLPFLKGAQGDIMTVNDAGEIVSIAELPFLGFDPKRRDPIILAATPQLGRRILGARG